MRDPLEEAEVSDLKRFSLVLGLTIALTLVFATSAFANFGPHGGYIADTDACAGCHRAHSSFSSIKYTPKIGGELLLESEKPSALLVGSATTMSEFCNACHGDLAPGASTNVVMGKFDGGPSSAGGAAAGTLNDGVTTAYVTDSTFGAPLNGGGFTQAANLVDWEAPGGGAAAYKNVTSAHSMEKVGVLWGAGAAATTQVTLTCTSCHDPHGSSNYRLLKDSVNGVAVGGYTGDTPNGVVFSTETGYDTVYADGGWLKHEDGQLQMASYVPNYTSGSSQIRSGRVLGAESLSVWCSACHTQYNQKESAYSYGSYEGGGAVGSMTRHRHPVDMPLTAGDTQLQVRAQDTADVDGLDRKIPLEVNPGVASVRQNTVGCLTCHYAHGGSATMTGWSAAHLEQINGVWAPVRDAVAGVEPDKADVAAIGGNLGVIAGTSALLRADQRGVCERCHNK